MSESSAHRRLTRVRRETRRRVLSVTGTEMLSRSMLRVHFTSPDLADFESDAPDDHLKLFVPDGRGGIAKRDYTPPRFDTALRTLTVDFVLHDAGPATRWAKSAKVGDIVEVGGPRGSTVVPDDFDWYLLVGDATAIPAVARRLEDLRPGVPVTAVIAVDGEADQVQLSERDGATVIWATGESDPAVAAVADRLCCHLMLPEGDGFVWIGAEASVARAVRDRVLALGHPKDWLRASGYWTRGAEGAHQTVDD